MVLTKLVAASLVVCGFFFALANGQGCTFPSDLDGVFETSHETWELTFNSTHVTPFTVDTQSLQFTNLVFECNFANGSHYVVRSADSFDIYTVPYYVYTCWEFYQMSTDTFVMYQATSKLASAADKNYKILPISASATYDDVCDVDPYTGDSVTVLVRNGTASSAKTSCPVKLWGEYAYQLTDTSGNTYCDFTSDLDICTSTDTLSINTTLCTTTTLYSTAGTLYCMFYMEDTSATDIYYVYLYNADTSVDYSTNYRFTCIVMYYTTAVTYMTQYPQECLDSSSQNYSYIATSPGGLYTMYANVTCPPATDGTDYTAVIVVTVLLLLIIIAGVIFGVYYYKRVYLRKKRDRLSSKVSPDGIPCSAMDKNYRMMFTPGPPKSAVPGRRRAPQEHQADTGSRAVSVISMRPTVSALAGYRTPTPFISDGKDVDVDSLLDFDYTTKQNLGDPDGEESGVMLEMDGSLPVYSEAGDTPEPTRRTPLGDERY